MKRILFILSVLITLNASCGGGGASTNKEMENSAGGSNSGTQANSVLSDKGSFISNELILYSEKLELELSNFIYYKYLSKTSSFNNEEYSYDFNSCQIKLLVDGTIKDSMSSKLTYDLSFDFGDLQKCYINSDYKDPYNIVLLNDLLNVSMSGYIVEEDGGKVDQQVVISFNNLSLLIFKGEYSEEVHVSGTIALNIGGTFGNRKIAGCDAALSSLSYAFADSDDEYCELNESCECN